MQKGLHHGEGTARVIGRPSGLNKIWDWERITSAGFWTNPLVGNLGRGIWQRTIVHQLGITWLFHIGSGAEELTFGGY